MAMYNLHPDRFFDPDESTRTFAREIYGSISGLPIISPHGHVDPAIFAHNQRFPNPSELFIVPDHYLFRMLYSQGIPLSALGIPTINGGWYEKDPKKIWKLFAEHYYLYNGTPTGVWLDFELNAILGIKEKPDTDNAIRIYDEINEKLASPEFLPRTLFKKFNIEILATTDTAIDSLTYHKKIIDSKWDGKIVPSFRPDIVTDLSHPKWLANIHTLEHLTGISIQSFKEYCKAIQVRRNFFRELGATATDHGVFTPYTHELSHEQVESIFTRALEENMQPEDASLFNAHMLMEHARMSCTDGLVMQLHPGCLRNHNEYLSNIYGSDKGHDIPVQTEYSNNLKELLNKYGNRSEFSFIVFTLDETTYSRELAPLAGHYPSMKLGPAWWFNDSINGITRYRQMITETAGFYNTVGFNDDTRAFLSIPARHDVARRVDANYLAGLVACHILNLDEAKKIALDLTYTLVKKAYRFS